MLDVLLIVTTFIVLLISSYTDLKTREVPDYLNYSFIFAALGIRAIFSLTLGWEILISGMLGLVAMIAVAFFFYYSNQWGGGDSKLLMGVGASIGITYPFSSSSLNLLWFLLGLLFLGAIYGLFWLVYLSIKNRLRFSRQWLSLIKTYRYLHLSTFFGSAVFLLLSLFYPIFWIFVILPWGTFHLFLFVNVVERTCFIKRIAVSKLTEGDWLAEDVRHGHYHLSKKTLEKDDIESIKKHGLHEVVIKEGIPFTPAFLLGYLAVVFGGYTIAPLLVRIFG
jgi:Flp pilus assembly protein protease CpaA